jgi:uncharacterized membrane protein AbrB (regulator of aidB expression)
VNREAWAKLVLYVFLSAALAGVYLMWGLPVALMVGGGIGAVCVLALHDIDPPEKKGP